MHRTTRRGLLASVAAGLTLGGVASGSGSAPPFPDHISVIEDDAAILEQYQPSFIADRPTRQNMIGTFGWVADSDQHDTRAVYYWTKHNTQESWFERNIPLVGSGPDGHFEDHEPFIVFYDPETGDIERTIKTGYHHFVLELTGASIPRRASVTDDATHTRLVVVGPWNHYRPATEDDRDGVLPETISGTDFESYLNVRDTWHRDGVFDSSNTRTIVDPFSLIEEYDHWWEQGSRDAWFGRHVWPVLGRSGWDDAADGLREFED